MVLTHNAQVWGRTGIDSPRESTSKGPPSQTSAGIYLYLGYLFKCSACALWSREKLQEVFGNPHHVMCCVLVVFTWIQRVLWWWCLSSTCSLLFIVCLYSGIPCEKPFKAAVPCSRYWWHPNFKARYILSRIVPQCRLRISGNTII